MSERALEQDDMYGLLIGRAFHFAPRYIAFGTAITLCWLYLIAGEFVLSGLPEGFGWVTVIAVTVANYWSLERRLIGYLPDRSLRRRSMTLLVVCLISALMLLFGLILGLLLPEPAVTLMLLAVLGILAFWHHGKWRRLYPDLPRDPRWRVASRIALVVLCTIVALGAMAARV
jgi:hypothetical protein